MEKRSLRLKYKREKGKNALRAAATQPAPELKASTGFLKVS